MTSRRAEAGFPSSSHELARSRNALMASGNIWKSSRRHDLPLYRFPRIEIAGLSHLQGEDKHAAFTFQAGVLQMERFTPIKLLGLGTCEHSLHWAVGRSPEIRATTYPPACSGSRATAQAETGKRLLVQVSGAGEGTWCKGRA